MTPTELTIHANNARALLRKAERAHAKAVIATAKVGEALEALHEYGAIIRQAAADHFEMDVTVMSGGDDKPTDPPPPPGGP